jgi:acylphosphatase
MAARHVVIAGRVQGVGYRAWLCGQADDLGITGWVRNRRDGTVEAHFEGPEDAVEELLRGCRRGPALARVSEITETIAQETGDPGFHSLATL